MRTKVLLLLLLLTISFIANAQVDFQELIISDRYYSASYPRAVYTGDIDGDGDVDILSASWQDDKIAWYENIDGEGYVYNQKIISTDINGANSVISSDIDGDGDIDVIASFSSANPEQRKIVWFENVDGAGNFGTYNIITDDSHGSNSVCATDIDGDGDIDILAASSGEYSFESELYWIENIDGQGNFGNKNIISTDLHANVLDVDIDNDGDMDVLSASFNEIAWFENLDGEGNFGDEQSLYWDYDGYLKAVAIDVDSDGDLDVVGTSQNYYYFFWFENTDGQGFFSSKNNIYVDAYGIREISSTDIDNDGDEDIIAGIEAYNSEALVWYENNNGVFNPYQTITPNTYGMISIHANDIDNDNDNDVFAVSYHNKISWLENFDSGGTFGTEQIITKQEYNVKQINVNYIDSDNSIDVISITFDNKIVWYKNDDGNGNYSSENFITSDAEYATAVYSADIDNDGDMDVLSSSFTDNKIAWYENINEEGTFGEQQIITTDAIGASSVYSSDIDNDGDMDVLSASSEDNTIAWYENIDGMGTFGNERIITTNAIDAKSVFAIDIDGDGDIDVLSASSGDNTIAWYENLEGEGVFSESKIISANADNTESVYASDIDNDGDIDVVSSSFNANIAWYENTDGMGNFTQHLIYTNDIAIISTIFTADIDYDNDMDIVVSCTLDYPFGNDEIRWFENTDGYGSFSGSQTVYSLYDETSASIIFADIDGDFDMDIISQSNKKLVWYDNQSLGIIEEDLTFFHLSPNPTSNSIIIKSKVNISCVEIFNCLGQLVSVIKNNHSINMSDLNEGIYFLRIKDENNNVENHKVIKE